MDQSRFTAALDALLGDLRADLRGARPIFVPGPGNAGDSLIAAAEFQALRRAGLDCALARPKLAPRRMEGRVVIIGGGGNLTPWYDDVARALTSARGRARRVLLLPSSVVGREDLLASLGPEFTLVSREARTEAHLRAHAPRAEVLAGHDAALALDLEELSRPVPLRGALRGLRRRSPGEWLALRRAEAALAARLPGGPVLRAFREDGEAAGGPLPPDNLDLSTAMPGVVAPEALARGVARLFLSVVARHGAVETDRLHVAIAGALTGRRLRLRDNSYGKLGAVFARSLPDLPGLAWMNGPPPGRCAGPPPTGMAT